MADIFGPPTAPALEAVSGPPAWALALLAAALVVVFGAVWRRRARLHWRWLEWRLRRGRLAPRETARRALRALRRSYGRGRRPARADPAAWEGCLTALNASCYGREAPPAAPVQQALARLRPWL